MHVSPQYPSVHEDLAAWQQAKSVVGQPQARPVSDAAS